MWLVRIRFVFIPIILLAFAFFPAHASEEASSNSARQMITVEGAGPTNFGSLKPEILVDKPIITVDFNGDDLGDLVVGSPLQNFAAAVDAGAINVVYSGSKGLTTRRNDQFIIDGLDADYSGGAIAVGDFNGDQLTDIAVGSYGSDGAEFGSDRGGVVLFIAKKGGGFDRKQSFSGDRPGDRLGFSLTSGDYNGDGYFDLAAGAIGRGFGSKINVGVVYTWKGSPDGLIRDRDWHLGSAGIKGGNKSNASFGFSLFSADINHDLKWDLMVGSPFGKSGRGTVNIIYGGGDLLTSARNQQVFLKSTDKASFGWSLGACYCNQDSFADPLIGAPDYKKGNGAGFLLFGSASGLSSTKSQFIQNPKPQEDSLFGYSSIAAGIDTRWMIVFGAPHQNVPKGSKEFHRSGAIYTFEPNQNGQLQVSGHFDGSSFQALDNLNFGYRLTANVDPKRLTLGVGAPGAKVKGVDGAGAIFTFQAPYTIPNSFKLSFHQRFDRGNLKGNPEVSGAFGLGLPSPFVYDRD